MCGACCGTSAEVKGWRGGGGGGADLCDPDADTSDLHLQSVTRLHQGVCT